MKIAESSPYGDAFASSIACVERVDLDDRRDGPERLLARDERIDGHAVEHRRLPVEPGREAVGARAAVHEPRAALERVGDVLVHLVRDAVVVQRPHRRPLRERVAEHHALLDERSDPGDELLAHRAVDEQSLARGAALAGTQEARGDGGVRREVEIGVVEHDHRAVARRARARPPCRRPPRRPCGPSRSSR